MDKANRWRGERAQCTVRSVHSPEALATMCLQLLWVDILEDGMELH